MKFENFEKFLTNSLKMNRSAVADLVLLLREKRLAKNEFIIQEGQICDFMAFVNSGVFRSFLYSDHQEFNNDFYLPNTIATTLTSYLTGQKTNCTIQALTDAHVFLFKNRI